MQPGQTIEPGQKEGSNQPPAELPPVESSSDPQELKLDHQLPEEPKTPQTDEQTTSQPRQEQNPAPASSQSFTEEPRKQWAPGPAEELPQQTSQSNDVQWSASEFIDHQKPSSWYLAVVGGGILLAGLLYLITQDIVSVIVVVIAAVLFSIIGSRKPRTLNYGISPDGLTIGEKLYPYTDIKSFTVMQDGPIQSIQLMPLKRFMPTLSMYYPPEQEDAILSTLSNYIPHEERRSDPVDRLMKRLRF